MLSRHSRPTSIDAEELSRRRRAATDASDRMKPPGRDRNPLRSRWRTASSDEGSDATTSSGGRGSHGRRSTTAHSLDSAGGLAEAKKRHDIIKMDQSRMSKGASEWKCSRLLEVPSRAVAMRSTALFVFSGTNRFRILIYNLTKTRVFEALVIALIAANCVVLALDDPTDDGKPHYAVTADMVFTAAFTAEMLLKVMSLGFVLHRGAYLRDSWNCLDFVIVLLSFLNFIPGFGNYTMLRALRVLRPLRSMNAIKGLKVLTVSLLRSVAGLLNVVMLAFFIFAIFGVLGVQLWGGLFRRRCQDIETGKVDDESFCRDSSFFLSGMGRSCPDGERCIEFENPEYGFLHFDHIGAAFLNIFTIMTMEDWQEILFITSDVFGPASFLYFFFLIVIAAYVIPNLSLAIISDKFNAAHHKELETEAEQRGHKAALLSDPEEGVQKVLDEEEMVGVTPVVISPRLDPAGSRVAEMVPVSGASIDDGGARKAGAFLRFRDAVHRFSEGLPLLNADGSAVLSDAARREQYAAGGNSAFAKVIIAAIFLNTAVMATQHYEQPEWLGKMAEYANYAFSCIFAVELMIRLTALGLRHYLRDPFNVIDALVVIASAAELGLEGKSTVSVFRSLRLLRILKLLKRFRSLQQIVRVVLNAASNTGYLNLIMLLYLFIFALLGMSLFGGKMKAVEAAEGRPIRWHYDSFLDSFYTVFQVLTRDEWVGVMYDTMAAAGPAAVLFFIAIVTIGMFTILNLFLSIIISSFEDINEEMAAEDKLTTTLNERLAHARDSATRDMNKFRPGTPFMFTNGTDILPLLPEIEAVASKADDLETSQRAHTTPPRTFVEPFTKTVSPSQLSMAIPLDVVYALDQFVAVADGEKCEVCGTCPCEVLPTAPLKRQLTVEEHHAIICWQCRIRKARTDVLSAVVQFVHNSRQSSALVSELDSSTCTLALQQMRSAGMMSLRTVDEFSTWGDLLDALDDERELVAWAIGEEQIGGALVSYTRAGVGQERSTNGGFALGIFGPENPVRVCITDVVKSKAFDRFILICIIISSLALAFDNPSDSPDSRLQQALRIIDKAFTAVFAAEMILKIAAQGLVGIKGAYLRDPWNWLDALIVATAVISLSITSVDLSYIKVLRTLRALRPLRVIRRNRGLRMIVNTLTQSVRGIINVAMLAMLNYIIFGILSVQLFAGKFHSCSDPTVDSKLMCTGTFVDVESGSTVSREWLPNRRNFDDLAHAMLTLFEVSSGELWIPILHSVVDARGVGLAPVRDYNPPLGLYVVVFFVISNFFMLNLLVGVVVNQFNNVKSEMDGLSLMTEEQKMWVETQRLMLNFRPVRAIEPKKNRVSQAVFRLVRRSEFEAGVGVAIFLNIAAIATEHHGMSPTWELVLEIANVVFVGFFFLEALLKILCFGGGYFKSRWNSFDGFLVVLSLFGLALTFAGGNVIPVNVGLLRVFRIFRLLRVLRLVKKARKVRILVETLWYSLPSIGNIALFMLLIFFVFSVLGVSLFHNVRTGEFIDDHHANFATFPKAMRVLFIFMTGEDWNLAMRDLMAQPPECSSNGSCGTPLSIPYFIAFILITAFVMVNLFVAVILENFEATMRLDRSNLSMLDLHRYVDIWSRHDPDATMLIPTEAFPSLLAELLPPLGISRKYGRLEVLRKSSRYRVPERGGFIHFVEVLIPLARACLEVELTEREAREHEESWKLSFPDLRKLPTLKYRGHQVCVDSYFCSTYLAAAFRRQRARRAVDGMRAAKQREIAACGGECFRSKAGPDLFFKRTFPGDAALVLGESAVEREDAPAAPPSPRAPSTAAATTTTTVTALAEISLCDVTDDAHLEVEAL